MKLTFAWPMMMFVLASLASCAVDTAPDGLRRTPEGPGARVVFEPGRRPLPELPLPNDVATFADPTSRTGRRVNLSTVAPTDMERGARSGLNELEGWGTYAPITVAFSKSESGDPRDAALDLEEIQRRMPKGDFEPGDDPVYIINLKTGVPLLVEMGPGRRPVVLRSPDLYWKNDPQARESNLFFETREEGAGLTQDQYRPELDTDFDGVLDHPNTLGKQGIDGYDNLLTWYERETDTLNLRPLVPMEEKTEYAVILTDRLIGSDGRPVRSAFEYIHHPTQKNGAARVRDILDDPSRRAYYGDLSGTGLDRVAFVWTFTTQPVQEDLLLLRDGLYGKGPFARFASQFPPLMHALPAAGSASPPDPQPEGWQTSPTCAGPSRKPYVFDIGDPKVLKSFGDTLASVTNPSARDRAALDDSLSHVDHIIVGDFDSPYLIGDPKREQPEDRFHVNFKTGEGDVGTDKVHFWMVVPKETATHKQPFPIVVLGHGYGGQAENALDIGADMARQGIATVTIDMPHHGIALPPSQEALLQASLSKICYSPFAAAVLMGRAQDVNGDGLKESGWWWWTPHLFHVRDNVRQGVLDSMQLTRIIATFDGRTRSDQDLNGDGVPELAGDFDANGIPDVGGPITAAGGSLGGIISQVQGGVDHQITAAAPIVGGGGLTDIGTRSYGVANSVMQQNLTPLVIAVPANTLQGEGDKKQTTCDATELSVRFVLNDGRDSIELELACLRPDELTAGMTVLVANVTSGEVKCAGTTEDGRFRVPLPASVNDRVDIQVYTRAHAVRSYGTCELLPDAPAGRRVSTFERAATVPRAVASDAACTDEAGCAQFLDRFFPVGSPLVAPQEGFGVRRQTPTFRRFFALGQAVLDVADPINFAPAYALRPLLAPDGRDVGPRPILNMPSVGDNFVAVAAEIAFGRAAGIVPFLPPDAVTRFPERAAYATAPALFALLGNKTPDQWLVDTYVTEGIARLERTPAGPACRANVRDEPDCKGKLALSDGECKGALYDADWISEGRMPFDQQHPAAPLRLTRRVDLVARDGAELDRLWEPRLKGTPLTPGGFPLGPPLMAQVHMYSDPAGAHGFVGGACALWDPQTYASGLVARFLATGGRDVLYISRPNGHQCLIDHSCDFFFE